MKVKSLGFPILALAVALGGLWASARGDRRTTAVVVATAQLSRYTVISDTDVTVERRHVPEGDKIAHNTTDVRDKLLLVPIEKDGIVHTTDVVAKNVVAGRSLLNVAVTDSPDAPGVGEHAMLIVSPKVEGFVGFVIRDVAVVRVTGAKSSANYTLTLLPDDLDKLVPLLAVADLRLTPPPADA
jgi:hypothetical protein